MINNINKYKVTLQNRIINNEWNISCLKNINIDEYTPTGGYELVEYIINIYNDNMCIFDIIKKYTKYIKQTIRYILFCYHNIFESQINYENLSKNDAHILLYHYSIFSTKHIIALLINKKFSLTDILQVNLINTSF